MHSPKLSRSLGAAVCLLQSACLAAHPWVAQPAPWSEKTFADSQQVRVERVDGSSVTMFETRIHKDQSGERITGKLAAKAGAPSREINIPIADVAQLETSKVSPAHIVVDVLEVIGITVVAAAGTLLIFAVIVFS